MTSGVSRARVSSRLRWRMISWPAANEMRCVNPSIATVSPSRTRSAMASCIDATLDVVIGRSPGSAGSLHLVHRTGPADDLEDLTDTPGNEADRVGEDPQARLHLRRADR